MNCFACERNLSAYLDDELTPDVRREVEAHLDTCETCRKDYETHLAAWEAAGHLRSEAAPEGLRKAVEAELQQGKSTTTEDLALIVRGLASEIRDLKGVVEALRQNREAEADTERQGLRPRDAGTQGLGLWTGPGVGRTRADVG